MSTTTQQKHNLVAFRYDGNRGARLPELLSFTPELEQGLEAFIKERGYHLLPGKSPALETWEGKNHSDRFLVVAHYGHDLLVIFCNAVSDYTRFMREHESGFSVWPEQFRPAEVAPPDNYYTGVPPLAKPVRW